MYNLLIKLGNDGALGAENTRRFVGAQDAGYTEVQTGLDQARCRLFCLGGVVGEPLLVSRRADAGVIVVAGDLALDGRSTADAIADVEPGMGAAFMDLLKQARGVFSAIGVGTDGDGLRVSICADKLAIRPVYHYRSRDVLVITSTLGVLRRYLGRELASDEAGVAETIAFGYPLASKTQFVGIQRVEAGEVVRYDSTRTDRRFYWRWDDIKTDPHDVPGRIEESYRLFLNAVEGRLHGPANAKAFLSGGMDSRAIVAALRELGASVTTVNLSAHESQDKILAGRIAERLGCQHLEYPRDPSRNATFRPDLASLFASLLRAEGDLLESRQIWSGDGGSVALGTVHLDEEIVALCRRGETRSAVRRYLLENKIGLPTKAMPRAARRWHSAHLLHAVEQELDRIDHDDPAQKMFLFLMLNDQRRHLDDMYEELHSHRLGYHLPFFDSEFLTCVFGAPLEDRLYHRFYDDWFGHFDPVVRSVPWQTYPGHVPCPLPIEEGLSYQWDNPVAAKGFGDRSAVFIKGLALAIGRRPVAPMSRVRLCAAAIAHALGIREAEYVFESCEQFQALRDGTRPS